MAKKKKKKDPRTRKQRAAARKRAAERPPRYVTVIGSHSTNTWWVKMVDGRRVVTAPLIATQIEVAYRDARILAAKYGVEFLPDKGLPDKHTNLELKSMTPREINEFYAYHGPKPKGPMPPRRDHETKDEEEDADARSEG